MTASSPKKNAQAVGTSTRRVTRSQAATTAGSASQQASRDRTVPIFDTPAHTGDKNAGSESESEELSESSEEPSSENSSEEESDEDSHNESEAPPKPAKRKIINVRSNRGEKPIMKLPQEDTDMRAFLKDFLPKLKAANEELEAERKAGTLQKKKIEVDDGEGEEEGQGQHIEMNLGLGVLEEKDPNAPSDSSDSDSDIEDPAKEKDILGKLLKREKKDKDPAQIEEVDMKDT